MKLIDLLVKIANKKNLPKKIVFKDTVFNLNGYKYEKTNGFSLGESYKLDEVLNDIVYVLDDEVVIEDKPEKIEKITMCTSGIMGFDGVENITTELKNKINEAIDKLNYLLEKSDKDV